MKRKTKAPQKVPREVKTHEEICALTRDHKDFGNFTLGFNHEGEMYLHEQKVGEHCRQKFLIPRRAMHALFDWYYGHKANAKARA